MVVALKEKLMPEWIVQVRGKVYTVKAYTNAEARWAGCKKYFIEHSGSVGFIGTLYWDSSTQCYMVNGRKSFFASESRELDLMTGELPEVERSSPGIRMARPKRMSPQFWSRVKKTDTCWIWTGYKTAGGYGLVTTDGVTTTAHRLSWELTHGKIPEGMDVLHTCDNPPCVNPKHLFLGTQQDNTEDSISKGRRKLRRPW